jgi:hypothetical protein
MTSAMSHQLPCPDWDAIEDSPIEVAAGALRAILARLQGIEERTFAMRGRALLIIKERQLYKQDLDLEVGRPFESMDRWLKAMHSRHHRYYQESLTAAENLREMAFEDFAALPRCNVKQLEKTSSNVRNLPDVIEAAKNLPEKEFVAKLNREHSQHLSERKPIVLAETEDVDEFESAIAMVQFVEDVGRSAAIKIIAISVIQEYAVRYEHMKEKTA